MKQMAWILTLGMAAALLCGCETVKGVGRDIEGASSSVEHAFTARSR